VDDKRLFIPPALCSGVCPWVQDGQSTAVLSKIPHSNCCKRVPNRPLRPRRGRFGTLLELLQCGIFRRTAVCAHFSRGCHRSQALAHADHYWRRWSLLSVRWPAGAVPMRVGGAHFFFGGLDLHGLMGWRKTCCRQAPRSATPLQCPGRRLRFTSPTLSWCGKVDREKERTGKKTTAGCTIGGRAKVHREDLACCAARRLFYMFVTHVQAGSLSRGQHRNRENDEKD